MRAWLGHRLVGVRHREQPGRPGDGRARDPARITRSVEPFTELRGGPPECGEPGRVLEHPIGEVRLEPNALPLRAGQRTRLVPDGVRDAEAAVAGDQRGPRDVIDILAV